MNKQNYKTKVLQIIIFAFAILTIQSTANAQTALEQQCFNAVQGKVAWNQAGNTSWSETNIRNLCRGTTNPSATISCFQSQIRQHNDWSRGIQACLPEKTATMLPNKIVEEKTAVRPSEPETVRTVTFKNNAHIQATLSFGAASSGQLNIGESKTVNIKESIGTPLQVAVTMRLPNPDNFVIYQGVISDDNRATNFCFEAKGDVAKPSVAPCNGTQATEARKVEFRNESGFVAKPTLNYFVNGVSKSVSADETSLGVNRVLYIPTDADKDKDVTLTVKSYTSLDKIKIDRNSGSSPCYKVWGPVNTPKINPCSLSVSARTIKFKNMGGFDAKMEVVYYDQFLQRRNFKSNGTGSLESDVIEIPEGLAAKPIEITLTANTGAKYDKKFYATTVPPNFTGEVCFKAEGTIFNPNASTCDDELNVTRDVDSRQIIFKNEAGYDAQISVMYFEMQNIGGTKVAMPKTVASGFINLGKSRTITIPKDIAPNQITIILQGNATVKNNIWSTTLPADFKSSPVPCFKTWGSLFDPQGGKCN